MKSGRDLSARQTDNEKGMVEGALEGAEPALCSGRTRRTDETVGVEQERRLRALITHLLTPLSSPGQETSRGSAHLHTPYTHTRSHAHKLRGTYLQCVY